MIRDSLLAPRFIRWYARDPSLSSLLLHARYSQSDRALIRAVLIPVLSSIVGLCNSRELLHRHHIALRKVKAHCGIRGNEVADWLAKTGRNLRQIPAAAVHHHHHHPLHPPPPLHHPPPRQHHQLPRAPVTAIGMINRRPCSAYNSAGGHCCKVFSGNDHLLKAYNYSFRFHTQFINNDNNNNNIACTA